MKLKGISKLLLAGTALAATAATLTTATYAWYVTNAEAKVDGIQATAKAGGLGNILVAEASSEPSAVNGHGAFKQNLTINLNNLIADKTTGETSANPNGHLLPASPQVPTYTKTTDTEIVTGKAYYTKSGEVYTKVASPDIADKENYYNITAFTPATVIDSNTEWYGAEGNKMDNGRYLTFKLWILSTDKDTVKFTFDVKNTSAAADVKKQIAYAGDAPVTQGNEFAVNIVDALRLSYTAKAYTKENDTYTEATNASTTVFDMEKAASSTIATSGLTFNELGTGNANSYYTNVLGAAPVITTGATVNGLANQTILVKPNTEMELTFYLWLEGPDTACFDSCAGQKVAFDFKFGTN